MTISLRDINKKKSAKLSTIEVNKSFQDVFISLLY